MKLYVVFGQRAERYTGEYAPEALHVADQFAMDENPDWIRGKLEEVQADDEFIAAEIVHVDLGGQATDAIKQKLVGALSVSGAIAEDPNE